MTDSNKKTLTIDRDEALDLAVRILKANQINPKITEIAKALGIDRKRIYERLEEETK